MKEQISVFGGFRYYGSQGMNIGQWNETENGYVAEISFRDYCHGSIRLTKKDNVAVLWLDLDCDPEPYHFSRSFLTERSMMIDVQIPGIQNVLSRYSTTPFWTSVAFENDLSKVSQRIQNMLLKLTNVNLSVLPLCHDSFYATICPSDGAQTLRIQLDKLYEGASELHGPVAVFSWDSDPYVAVKEGFVFAKENGLISTELREKKHLPDIYRGLGWCTWNAFYHDVTEQGILEKLEEFRAKGVPVKWVMIDDGWSQFAGYNSFELTSFTEDRKKFPNGLKGCIRKMKEEYGVEAVGVWHALTGYWYGIEKESGLAQDQRHNLEETNAGWLIPGGESAYGFFRKWHGYLKEQGVDFVKIDTQGNVLEFLVGKKDCLKKAIQIQSDIDRSVVEVFGGNVINCMGMNNINALHRPYTALSRNSDDFFPDKEGSFKTHLIQNAFNAVFHGCLFHCDYDMWWTNHESAKQNSILRAISGGPVYLSDKVGDTRTEYLRLSLKNDGSIDLCDGPALPTMDCLYQDPANGVLKLYNTMGQVGVVAVFNLSEQEQTVCVSPKDFSGIGDYAVSGFYSGIKAENGVAEITLTAGDAEIFYFYPNADK